MVRKNERKNIAEEFNQIFQCSSFVRKEDSLKLKFLMKIVVCSLILPGKFEVFLSRAKHKPLDGIGLHLVGLGKVE